MIEIERKFLVTSEAFISESINNYRIVQGFLNTNPNRTVRIRIQREKAFITVKGIGNSSGISRFEWEKEITRNDAAQLLKICEPGVIEKIRFEIPSGKHTIEVDQFLGENNGLILAEIELTDENEPFVSPDWLGKEVTGDPKYYNSQLSKTPYATW
ncbi:CYTH domain-containing protein [Aquimarina sp. U1-2]|uniref:CYTH domain-containing protein n=1 Tax=Aquimarina sp. U1-2 TaxID=2823141 RepID=UPI001AECBB52|nr:CYTH domain-containing protein [Aquimarina sp. U1-2]MBP2833153.1 CYTH domain-containing protein [Aquimarina sp. U1-2]